MYRFVCYFLVNWEGSWWWSGGAGTWLALVCICDYEDGYGYMGIGVIICIVVLGDMVVSSEVKLDVGLRYKYSSKGTYIRFVKDIT